MLTWFPAHGVLHAYQGVPMSGKWTVRTLCDKELPAVSPGAGCPDWPRCAACDTRAPSGPPITVNLPAYGSR
ncbi:hypothetical protein GCM10012275_63890 [Longimycelium tulufanense]|uniref:Uncharacterized protein n=1 Tax=Longimycelium tulufanense TaxID=907463 RepID=A0A8J3FX93_9PSEU|nr:hypothetical protein [Longimycelium tulufanense]GGM84429.1 hypothetical protein GCM10012275_63890 [Longimycelium tulufanense]